MKKQLEGLLNCIDEIQSLEVGLNINDADSAYDVVLYSEFKNKNDLDKYQIHPEHLKVGEFVKKVRLERAVVDYFVE
ncbi:Dabb family protein [Serpentinicella sp. ANB-PHB4]|uniref:Dabb family protein n=1 Tax=Serpentinicella sp. ANB-PHB4 TaxID=3074076 RepID=UPI002F40DC15